VMIVEPLNAMVPTPLSDLRRVRGGRRGPHYVPCSST
jgi:hypothetical protein